MIQRYNLVFKGFSKWVSTLALHGTLSVAQMLTHLQRAPRTCTARNAVLRQCHSTSGGNVEFSHPGFTQWILNVQNPCDIASYCFTRVPINAHCDPHHITFRSSSRETFQIRVINLDKLGSTHPWDDSSRISKAKWTQLRAPADPHSPRLMPHNIDYFLKSTFICGDSRC